MLQAGSLRHLQGGLEISPGNKGPGSLMYDTCVNNLPTPEIVQKPDRSGDVLRRGQEMEKKKWL